MGSIRRGYDDGKTGAHTPPDAEWNIKCDPAGAKALLASGVPVFMMPLDSTQIHLQTPDREAIFAHGYPLTDQLTPALLPVVRAYRVAFAHPHAL